LSSARVRGYRAGVDDPVEGPIGRLGWIQIDCRDPLRLAQFWSEVLGVAVDDEPLGDPPHYVILHRTVPGGPKVCFQRVPEPKVVKNRLHLDIAVEDVEKATERVEALGGRRVADGDFSEYGVRWRVMTDPEGNEFCLIY
jgi:predicted enzyme related to lactoylglutathione lyase